MADLSAALMLNRMRDCITRLKIFDLEEHRFFIVRKLDALNRQRIAAKGALAFVAHHLGRVFCRIHFGTVVLSPLIIPLIDGPVLVIHCRGGIERIAEGDLDSGLFHIQRGGHVDGFAGVTHTMECPITCAIGLPDA